MKTFSDLEFFDHPAPYVEGVQAVMDFDNGWSISVVQTSSSYGGTQGLFELAVFKNGQIHYDNPVADGDVLGYLTDKQVTEAMKGVQEFDKTDIVVLAEGVIDPPEPNEALMKAFIQYKAKTITDGKYNSMNDGPIMARYKHNIKLEDLNQKESNNE